MMSAADISFSFIPAKMETGICAACDRESFCCGFVIWKKRKRYLCSGCRLSLAGEWRAVESMNMSDFTAKRERLTEIPETKSVVEIAYDEGR